jgi:hypothetical protein
VKTQFANHLRNKSKIINAAMEQNLVITRTPQKKMLCVRGPFHEFPQTMLSSTMKLVA